MATVAKAIAAFCTSATGATTLMFSDGTATLPEILIAIFTVIGSTVAVYAIPNANTLSIKRDSSGKFTKDN